MSVVLIVDAKLKSDKVSDAVKFFAEIVPDTRNYDGCLGVDVCIDSEDVANLVLVERWVSMDHYQKYHHWREETGVLDQLRSFLDGPPGRRVLNIAA